ncbi:MAG: hypothetical protein ABL998_24610, partial [Planctomycetota bacterium]
MSAPVPARIRRQAVVLLWLANLAIGTVVGSSYLVHVPAADGWRVWLFALPALVSSVLTLTLVPGTLFLLGGQLVRSTQ